MLDLLQEAQDAFFAALKALEGNPALPDGWGAFQHIPQDRQPPYSMIGMVATENQNDKGEQEELVSLELQHVYRGPGRAPLLDMMHAVRSALDGVPIASATVAFEPPRFIKAEASDVLADGATYVGIQIFELYAEPA